MSEGPQATRRIEITMRKPWFALYGFVKPTLVIAGRAQPVQWGLGTWRVSSGEPVPLGTFLFNRLWRFGRAELVLEPQHPARIEYRAPVLPFLPGRIRVVP